MEKKLVNTFLLGFPKSGTTALYYFFRAHPDIYAPEVKEPNFFSKHNLSCSYMKKAKGHELYFNEYINLFDNAYPINVDCSTSYIRDIKSLKNIHKYNSSAKIIVILRNPLEIVSSWHYQKIKEGQEQEYSFKRVFLSDMDTIYDMDHLVRIDTLDYRKVGSIRKQISNVKILFQKENILIIDYVELKHNPHDVQHKITDFLGIKYKPFTIPVKNKTNRVVNNTLRKLSRRLHLQEIAKLLNISFLSYIAKNVLSKEYNKDKNIQFLKKNGFFKSDVEFYHNFFVKKNER